MKNKRARLLLAGIILAVPVLFACTATYSNDGHGVCSVSRAPFLTVSWGPRDRYIIQDGINVVPDRTPGAQAGNFVEFPLFPGVRASLRLWSKGWWDYEYAAWKSNHRK